VPVQELSVTELSNSVNDSDPVHDSEVCTSSKVPDYQHMLLVNLEYDKEIYSPESRL